MAKAWPLTQLVAAVLVPVGSGAFQSAPAVPVPPASQSRESTDPKPATPLFKPTAPDPARGAWLLNRAVEALGGAAAVDGMRTLEIHGKGTRDLVPSGRMEVRTTTYLAPPDRYRQEVTTPGGTACTLLNPQGAFFILVEKEMTPLSQDDRARLAQELRRNLVVLLQRRKEPGFLAMKIGDGVADGAPVEMVEVGAEGDDRVTLGVEPASGLARQLVAAQGSGKEAGQLVVTYSDYRDVGSGLKYPFRAAGHLGGELVLLSEVEQVSVNGKLDPRLFATPTPTNFFWRPEAPNPAPPRSTPPTAPKP